MPIKVRDLIRIVEGDGWTEVSIRGSHRQFKHPLKTGRVTIPGKAGDDVNIKTEKSIYKQAKIDRSTIR